MKLIRKPFKGFGAYEWQIGPLVIQWVHTTEKVKGPRLWAEYRNPYDGSSGFRIHRLLVWTDPYWRRPWS